MINKENLELFIYERLRYKVHIKVEYWDLTNNSLHIVFVGGFGEMIVRKRLVAVHINKFNEWYKNKRDKKINKILNKI